MFAHKRLRLDLDALKRTVGQLVGQLQKRVDELEKHPTNVELAKMRADVDELYGRVAKLTGRVYREAQALDKKGAVAHVEAPEATKMKLRQMVGLAPRNNGSD